MASSILNSLVLGAIATGKIVSIVHKKRNRLIIPFNNTSSLLKEIRNSNLLDYTSPTQKGNTAQTNITVNFDIVKSWNYKNSIKLTQNPVEQGVNITDHSIYEPMKITMEVGVSNLPNLLNSFTSTQNVLQSSKLLFTAGIGIANSPIEATYKMLKIAMVNSEPFDIETPLGRMKNFKITSFESTNDNTNYGAFEGTIELQEIIQYSSENTDTPKVKATYTSISN